MRELRTKTNKTIVAGGLVLFFCLFSSVCFAANSKPLIGTINPSSGSSNPYQPVSFTTTFTDDNGWQDIQYVHLLINTAINGANCFYGYYKRSTHQLYLRDSANKKWLGGFILGSSNVIENNQVKLDCLQTSVSGSGTTLTINWSVAFKSTFTGTKNTYLYVKDLAGSYSGWTKKGTFKINAIPKAGTVTPSPIASNPGQTVTFVTTYTDSNGLKDIQYVHFLINTGVNGVNCFSGYYNQNEKKLYLRDDTDATWLGGFNSLSKNTIENSYVKLDCSKTSISGSGSTLGIKWTVTFKSTFSGIKNTYLYVKDNNNAESGWIQKGNFCVFREPILPPN